jgi:hypothetical protein
VSNTSVEKLERIILVEPEPQRDVTPTLAPTSAAHVPILMSKIRMTFKNGSMSEFSHVNI